MRRSKTQNCCRAQQRGKTVAADRARRRLLGARRGGGRGDRPAQYSASEPAGDGQGAGRLELESRIALLIDGNQTIPAPLFRIGEFSGAKALFTRKPSSRAINCVISIAAASILAKVARDAMMVELDKQYPEYGFRQPTKAMAARRISKRCSATVRRQIHRQSFRPVRDAVDRAEESRATV